MAEPRDGVAGTMVLRVPSMTTIRLARQRDRVDLRLGGQEKFTVGLVDGDLTQLMIALVEGETSYVACTHDVCGGALLHVRPTDDSLWEAFSGKPVGSPRELGLDLPELGSCRVQFNARQAAELVVQLDAAWRLLDRPRAD